MIEIIVYLVGFACGVAVGRYVFPKAKDIIDKARVKQEFLNEVIKELKPKLEDIAKDVQGGIEDILKK